MTVARTRDYELGEPIERSGRTITYRAEWSSPVSGAEDRSVTSVRRAVLVKTIKPGIRLTPSLTDGLAREAARLSELDHPLWPTLVDFVADDDQVALVVPDRGGVRLDVVLERLDRLQARSAMAIGIEVARALAAIHRHGWVHGHLEAQHVELCPAGTVRLFGLTAELADVEDVRSEGDEELRMPENMAPEQIVGDQADVRTDVFLLGLLLYRLAAGDRPFRSGGGTGVGQRIRHERPERLQRLVPEVTASFDRIVMRCLSKRPKDRYPDMPSVATALLRALRSTTATPLEHLVSHTLARADLAQELSPPAEAPERPAVLSRGPFRRLALPVATTLVAATAVWWLASTWGTPRPAELEGARGIEQRPAQLRVLARPWAEVHVDGKRIDVTPMSRPIEISPGRHSVRFKHPNAPDQLRSVEVIAGQTLWLDVTMAVTHPSAPGAGSADASADASP